VNAFGMAMLAGDMTEVSALLHPDVTFSSPAVFQPYRGRAATLLVLAAAAETFEDFSYVAEAHGPQFDVLRFRARVGRYELEGVDILTTGEDGQITDVTVMVRPLRGLEALVAAMQQTLARLQESQSLRGGFAPAAKMRDGWGWEQIRCISKLGKTTSLSSARNFMAEPPLPAGQPDELRSPTRRAGPSAEVDASPKDPAIGAFFDLDGTLVAGYTAAAQTRDRLRRRDLRVLEFLTVVELAVQFRLGRRAFETLIEGSALTVRGRRAADIDEMGERIFRQSVTDLIYPEMRELVRAHQRRGHTVVLSSSALTNQVAPVAHYLGISYIVCNRLVADEQGILTGEVEQPVVWGPTKASGVQEFAAEHQVDLKASYFYADGDEDLSLMCLVGHPRPTNPGRLMTKVAVRRGWPIMVFGSRGSGGPIGLARRLASISSIGPLGVAALGVGLVRRNKRAGVNVLTRFWPGTVLALSGVKLNVTGAEHLTERRPAVFLFNLRNNVDVFLVAALVKDNWTGVADKELQSSRVFGRLGKLLDAAFVDREDPRTAVAALKPLEPAFRKGLSILIAPEGARLDTRSVGPFKKRAFLVAMATGLPVVPIVIRNSESVAGRNAVKLNPGTVDIAVLPPVSVKGWTLRNLRGRIEQVRGSYLETLADWPAPEPDGHDETPS
jgi:putative phosphoserine phosphatase / 1-acylglycerol-3-phosphate O-acyltransferase